MLKLLQRELITLFRYKSTYLALLYFWSSYYGTSDALVNGVERVWVDKSVVYNWFEFEGTGLIMGEFVIAILVSKLLVGKRAFKDNDFDKSENKMKMFTAKFLLMIIITIILVSLRSVLLTVRVAKLMEVENIELAKMGALFKYSIMTLVRNLALMSTYFLIDLFIKGRGISAAVCMFYEYLLHKILEIFEFSKILLFCNCSYMQLKGIEIVIWIANCVIIGVVCTVLAFKGWNKKISNWGN